MNTDLNVGSKNVSMAERKNIAEKFTITKSSEGNMTYKIIDLPKYAEYVMNKREELKVPPFVQIKPIYVNKVRNDRHQITFVKDSTFDVYYGRFRGFGKHGDMQWNRIDIDGTLPLNLNNIADVQIWIVVRMHSSIQGSPFESHATYKVDDPLEEALSENKRATSLIDAFNRVSMLKGKELIFFSRFVGCEVPEGANSEIVKGILNKRAYDDPFTFNNLFTTRDRGIKELVNTALTLSVIKQTKEGFKFEGMHLGMMREDVTEYFKENAQYVKTLTDKVMSEDSVSRIVENEKESSIKSAAAKLT
jgi:hypothetical protein